MALDLADPVAAAGEFASFPAPGPALLSFSSYLDQGPCVENDDPCAFFHRCPVPDVEIRVPAAVPADPVVAQAEGSMPPCGDGEL